MAGNRVTDEMVRSWLVWTRNFGEIVAFHVGEGAGRRFRVRLPAGVTSNGDPFRQRGGILDITGHGVDDVVPSELLFTAREALAFGFGCAVGRTAALASERPKWCEGWTPEARAEFERRREAAREEDQAAKDREAAEREAERQRRMADYRRRKGGGVRQIAGGGEDG